MDVTASANAILVNHYFNLLRRRLGNPYGSLSAFLKHRVKNAVSFISDFEHLVADEASRREVDAIMCGHIHKAELHYIDDIQYCNTGDWVESCTAMVENQEGVFSIVHWADEQSLFHRENELLRPVPAPGDVFVIGLDQIGPVLSCQSPHGEVAVGHVLKMLHEDQVAGCPGSPTRPLTAPEAVANVCGRCIPARAASPKVR